MNADDKSAALRRVNCDARARRRAYSAYASEMSHWTLAASANTSTLDRPRLSLYSLSPDKAVDMLPGCALTGAIMSAAFTAD